MIKLHHNYGFFLPDSPNRLKQIPMWLFKKKFIDLTHGSTSTDNEVIKNVFQL